MALKREFSLLELVLLSLAAAILAFIIVQRYLEVMEKARMGAEERRAISAIRAAARYSPPAQADLGALDLPYAKIANQVVGLRYSKEGRAAASAGVASSAPQPARPVLK